jgi:hypothetical protein
MHFGKSLVSTFGVIELQALGGAVLDNPLPVERKRAVDPYRIDVAAEPAALEWRPAAT